MRDGEDARRPDASRAIADRRSGGVPGWLPDAVTLVRIALTPAFLVTAEGARAAAEVEGAPGTLRLWAVALLLAIAGSDKLDGYLARRSRRGPTRRGAFLDALADRLIQWSGAWFFALRAAPAFTPLPLWLPLALVGRDGFLLLAWLRTPRSQPVELEHEVHGKVTTVAVFAVLVGAAVALPAAVVTAGAAAAGVTAVYSATRYAQRMRRPEGARGDQRPPEP